MRIAAAGNVEVPAYLALVAKGYAVERKRGAGDRPAEAWIARKDDVVIEGESPIQLLGVAAMYESRGHDWMASDADIEKFIASFY